MNADLTARVAELAASIEAHLAEDEATAKAAIWDEDAPWPGQWEADGDWALKTPAGWVLAASAAGEFAPGLLPHIARNDPARTLRRVRATRDLAAAILAERHDYNESDRYYSCSQAADPDPCPGESGGPGSGCSNPDRAGKPCDCGRDARVARLLGIIASEWEETA